MVDPFSTLASATVVFALVAVAIVLFIDERVPMDIAAITVMVATMFLEPWTGVGVADGFSGFSNPAVLTVLAMFILSEGIRRTGLLHRMARRLFRFTGDDEGRQLAATVGLSGPLSGVINNTPIVAMMIPTLHRLADDTGTSVSQLLIPLSYAAIAGGLLTLIGSSSNLIASAIAGRTIGQSFTMFEFTVLGLAVFAVTAAYLLTVGSHLLPDRKPAVRRAEVEEFLTEILIEEGSDYQRLTVRQFLQEAGMDIDVVKLVRDGEEHLQPFGGFRLRDGDILVVRAEEDDLVDLIQDQALSLIPETGREHTAIEAGGGRTLKELVILPGSDLVNESLVSSAFRQRYDASILAVHRQGETIGRRLNAIRFRPGDTLFIQTTEETLAELIDDPGVAVVDAEDRMDYRQEKAWMAAGIMGGVVGLAALNILPIVLSAFAGVVAMLGTGCLKPRHLYDAVDWQVIFLLAGVIPLGMAVERSGAAAVVADGVLATSPFLPAIGILGLTYTVTMLFSNIADANAGVILMSPVAIQVAQQLGLNPFAFMIAVTFGAGTAFMSPVGYQTNVMVFGPGDYTVKDFLRIGVPLQILLIPVITVGIALLWSL